ncbi:TIGR02302 family protein [Roseovarius amoyensis]|uniref:TIGR02302 family protein n=1 Tax=Roseovarius amoyensis TaxID=2211448 RepID=UPI000DBE9C43|nr:TIGR02302 family protein [Roseovarius amoyensis]
MAKNTPPSAIMARLRLPLALTWAGLAAERLVRAFWPLWTLVAAVVAVLMLGLHDHLPAGAPWPLALLAGVAMVVFAVRGALVFRWPARHEALARIDSHLAGRPLSALADAQAVGKGDPQSEALWRAHLARMAERTARARAVAPDLRLASRDPFGLRYVALLMLVVGLMFGSVLRVGTVARVGPGGGALAGGPAWEGWIEPPAYTGLPSLYLNDQNGEIRVPEGSRVTLRLYGEVGALGVAETVSDREVGQEPVTGPEQFFDVARDGTLEIAGPGGRSWTVTAIPDTPPEVALMPDGAKTDFDGQMSQPFHARDDYGVVQGRAVFRLDMAELDRRHGLAVEPEPREDIVLDLPMPIAGDRSDFIETLIENLSQHPWAHLPVVLELEVHDEAGQAGQNLPAPMTLPARRFFDPLAASVIEQRRDLLWSRENAPRVAQVMRAISHRPETGLFRSNGAYLRFRVILRRLETLIREDALSMQARDEIAQALWDLGVILEDGDIGDALARMRAAQERLGEAMRNGASEEEIARLMDELRDATQDYLRQKAQQAQREGDQQDGDQELSENMMMLDAQDLQDMLDRIQELMEQGRFAEAEQALREFQQMMENLRMAEGQQGQQGQSPGEQAMEGLADTLRDQQGLSDQAFRDLQEQFNPGARSGQSQENEGRDGGLGRGQSHQPGQGEGQGGGQGEQPGEGQDGQSAEGQGEGSLADRQEALRRELERQRGSLPGAGTEGGDAAREALDRAERAMRGAEDALRREDLAEALDSQAEAIEALREGMRNLGEALAENNRTPGGQGEAMGRPGDEQSDPLGRRAGRGAQLGSPDSLLQGEDVYRRARELLDEIRRRSGQGERPDVELEYLRRLLERF